MIGGLIAPFGGLADARHHFIGGREQRDLEFRHNGRHFAHHEGNFGVRLGGRAIVRRGVARRRFGEQSLRIEGRDIGGKVGNSERQIAGDAHERTNAHDFVVAYPINRGDADHLAGERRLFGSRQTVALVRAPFTTDAECAAKRNLHPFGQRGEIGLPVERRENGATHESSAAERGQNRAGKPLHRNAAAIDEAARAAIDRQRRLIAELNGVGLP